MFVAVLLFALSLMPVAGQSRNPFESETVLPSASTQNPGSGNIPAAPDSTPGISANTAVAATAPATSNTAWIRMDMGTKSGQVVCITQDKVNLRSGPGTEFSTINQTTFGNLYQVLSEKNGWYQIALGDPDKVLPRSSPAEVEAVQKKFLSSYKAYTSSVLTNGKAAAQSQTALTKFRADYAAYKVAVHNSVGLEQIRAGKIKVDKVVVSKADFTATLYANGQVVRVYPIAYGSNPDGLNKKKEGDCRTPEGNFKVAGKAVNPQYRVTETGQVIPGGAPNNPFGTRYIGLNTWGGSIGMHGTSNPGSIGTRASHGCMRMFTPDNEEMFDLVKVGTPITVLPVSAG